MRLLAARLILLLATLPLALPLEVLAAPGSFSELPDIGTPADSILTPADEYQLGGMVIKELRDAGQIMEDPEISEYVQGVGDRLVGHTAESSAARRFHFYVIKEADINAFALPGGYVCINLGLILATKSESELAGVMAHEISHVTQRHTVRQIQAAQRGSLLATAAMLAAILAGAAAHDSNVGLAGVMASQSASIQAQLNYSRESEYEADRIGIGVMAASGFEPAGMAAFFETMGRRTGAAGPNAKIIEFLQTHPVTSARVAEAKARAAAYPVVRPVDSVSYSLTRERLRVFSVPVGQSAEAYYGDVAALGDVAPDYRRYGHALALMQDRQWAAAVPELRELVQQHADVIDYHTALGQALLGAGDTAGSQAVLQRAMELFPRNVPVTVRYAETLMQAGNPKLAHAVLLDLFNVINPTQPQIRLIALAANAAGETAEAYYYTAESYVQNGDLLLAINTLRIALSTPDITPIQRSRFKARIDELKEYLPARAQAAIERGDPIPEPRQPPTQGRR